jgi:hypothetical protein
MYRLNVFVGNLVALHLLRDVHSLFVWRMFVTQAVFIVEDPISFQSLSGYAFPNMS